MTDKKPAPAPRPKWQVGKVGDVLHVAPPIFSYRVLFSSGAVLDVVSTWDNSDMRGVLLEYAKEERIEGITGGRHVGWVSTNPAQPAASLPPA